MTLPRDLQALANRIAEALLIAPTQDEEDAILSQVRGGLQTSVEIDHDGHGTRWTRVELVLTDEDAPRVLAEARAIVARER